VALKGGTHFSLVTVIGINEVRADEQQHEVSCCGTGRTRRTGEDLLEEGASQKKGAPKAKKGAEAAKPKKQAKAGKKAKPAHAKEASTPRAESKGARILELIGRFKGATLAEIVKATDWQKHSIRGFLSTAAKKHDLKIESTKTEAGDRVYQIKK
jgi:hypothetical protein